MPVGITAKKMCKRHNDAKILPSLQWQEKCAIRHGNMNHMPNKKARAIALSSEVQNAKRLNNEFNEKVITVQTTNRQDKIT